MPQGKGTYGSQVGRPKKVKNKMGYSMGGMTGKQSKLDKNKDGKISGEDFKMMAGGGMAKMGYSKGGKVKVRGTGAATKGLYARGPMA